MAAQVFVALIDETQEYQRLQAQDARAAAARLGVTLEIAYAENNAVVQIQQVFERVHRPEGERPAAIVVHAATGEGLQRVARNAVHAGIGWIVLNRRVGYVEELRTQRLDLPIATVTPDQVEIGRIHGRQVRALAPQGGLILYVQGPADTSSAQDRLRGCRETAGDRFSWKVLNGDWTEPGAEKAVAAWLRLKTSDSRRPTVIVAQSDAMAVGARKAAGAHHPDWFSVPVLGCDGLPAFGQRLVSARQLAATVVVPATAGTAVDLLARWLRERSTPAAEVVLSPASCPAVGTLRPRSGETGPIAIAGGQKAS